MANNESLSKALECLLFAAQEPVPLPDLAKALQVEADRVPAIVEKLQNKLQKRGLHVVTLAGGYSLATRPEYAEEVERLLEPDPEQLSVPALEALAIIAYNQPITRPEIDEIRGVNSTGTVNTLLQKGLLRVAGRKDAPGRPFLLETTPHFLSAFGLKDLSELPSLSALQTAIEAGGDFSDADQERLPVENGSDDDNQQTGENGNGRREQKETSGDMELSKHEGNDDSGADAEG